MPAMEPGRLHRKRWSPSIGTRGRVQSDCTAAIVGIRTGVAKHTISRVKDTVCYPGAVSK